MKQRAILLGAALLAALLLPVGRVPASRSLATLTPVPRTAVATLTAAPQATPTGTVIPTPVVGGLYLYEVPGDKFYSQCDDLLSGVITEAVSAPWTSGIMYPDPQGGGGKYYIMCNMTGQMVPATLYLRSWASGWSSAEQAYLACEYDCSSEAHIVPAIDGGPPCTFGGNPVGASGEAAETINVNWAPFTETGPFHKYTYRFMLWSGWLDFGDYCQVEGAEMQYVLAVGAEAIATPGPTPTPQASCP